MADKETKMYQRWDIQQRFQHWIMVISFTILTVTGILIKFAHTGWAQTVSKIFGSFEILFAIHIIGAVLMAVSAVCHVAYIFTKLVKRELRWTMLPGIKDVKDFFGNLGFFTGIKKEAPKFGKYSYKEKVDYLAEYWGTPVMLITGLILMFPGKAAAMMPRWVVECAHFAHQGEGMLAILVIFTWHMYSVHFSPDFFPMNNVWLTGKMSREVMKHEYALELERIEAEEGTC